MKPGIMVGAACAALLLFCAGWLFGGIAVSDGASRKADLRRQELEEECRRLRGEAEEREASERGRRGELEGRLEVLDGENRQLDERGRELEDKLVRAVGTEIEADCAELRQKTEAARKSLAEVGEGLPAEDAWERLLGLHRENAEYMRKAIENEQRRWGMRWSPQNLRQTRHVAVVGVRPSVFAADGKAGDDGRLPFGVVCDDADECASVAPGEFHLSKARPEGAHPGGEGMGGRIHFRRREGGSGRDCPFSIPCFFQWGWRWTADVVLYCPPHEWPF